MITLMMKTLKTKFGSSYLDFFNLEEWIELLDDYSEPSGSSEPYPSSFVASSSTTEFIEELDFYAIPYEVEEDYHRQ